MSNLSSVETLEQKAKLIRKRKKVIRKTAVLDLETDPFQFGRVPCPFVAGFYDGEEYRYFWGDDCIVQIVEFLAEYKEPLCIYAHNGGKFDYWYFSDYLSDPLMFINTRIAKAQLHHHEVRDSFSIIPVPLSMLQKDKIDYRIMEYEQRELPRNKAKILKYLKSDCVYLYTHVQKFLDTFGNKLTMGSASWKMFTSKHDVPRLDVEDDAEFRPFYYGGRVECFESGVLKGNWKFYDVNSSYPYAMKSCEHPATLNYRVIHRIPDSGFYFAEIWADSDGALPIKTKRGLQFPHVRNERFFATSHEIREAENLGLLRIRKIRNVFHFQRTTNFASFVDHCMAGKIAAEMCGDHSMRLFWKLIANASYGKAGSNPENYRDVRLFESREALFAENDSIKDVEMRWRDCGAFGSRILGERPVQKKNYLNVGIAASITSAARAHLLRAIHKARRPIYCDTDSLICESLDMPLHSTELGAWKLEAEADEICIAGRKLYAAFQNGVCVKAAAKGVGIKSEKRDFGIDPNLLRDIANNVPSDEIGIAAPSLTLGKPARFQKRTLARTV